MLRALWNRLLGMRPRTQEHWRAWAIEQAVQSGAKPWEVNGVANDLLAFVFNVRGSADVESLKKAA